MIFPEDEEFLAHYGKKGMKWGVRKKQSAVGRINADTYNKSLPGIEKRVKQLNKKPESAGGINNPKYRKEYNKIVREEQRKVATKKVLKARDDIKTGKIDKYEAKIEAKYIQNKVKVGKKEAKRIYEKDAEKITDTLLLSKQAVTGKEFAKKTLGQFAAGFAIGALAAGAAAAVSGGGGNYRANPGSISEMAFRLGD